MRWWLALIAIVLGSWAARAQFVTGTTGFGAPGNVSTGLQFNTNGVFGGITGVTSDSANVGFATSSNLILYGLTASQCVQLDGSHNLVSAGVACGGSGSATNIAAGTNITTSGTTANVTVALVPSPTVGALTVTTVAAVPGFLTASGANLQTATIVSLGGSTQCVESIAGVITGFGSPCGGTSATNIAAGTNITTSGTTANVTVALVPSPTVGALTVTTVAAVPGWLTASGVNLQTVTVGSFSATTQCVQAINGALAGTGVACATQTSTPSIVAGTNITTSGTAANTTVNVVATPSFTTVIASGNLTAGSAQFAGFLTAGGASISGLSLATGTISGNLTGSTANLSGNLTAGTAQFTGAVTGTTAVFQTITDALLGGCLQATSGVISSTGVNCATQVSTPSIAAGTNITTSGTAANTTVNLVATPSVTTLIASGNLTAATAQFSGFMTAGGASLSGLTIATETLSSNLTGTTANFSGNLTGTTAQFTGAVTGTSAQFQTYAGSTANLTGNLTGTTAQFSNTVTGTTAQFQTFSGNVGNLAFTSPSVAQFGLSATPGPTGWMNWGGEKRITADFGIRNSATLTPTALSVNVQAGRTYSVDADLYIAQVAATAGIQVALSGTYGSTNTQYFGYAVDAGSNNSAAGPSNPIRGAATSSAQNGIVANAVLSGTTGYVKIIGTITVNTAGTLVVVAAQNTANAASNTTLSRGSRLLVHDMP